MDTVLSTFTAARFLQELDELKAQNDLLQSRIEELINENTSLKAQIIKLEDRLNINSSNSSLHVKSLSTLDEIKHK